MDGNISIRQNSTSKIGNEYSHSGHPNGGVPQGTLSGPKCFLVYINDLRTTLPLYKYVDDSTLFEICDRNDVSVIQESVDIAARWTEQNDMNINSEKSKEIIISFAQDGNFRSTIPNIKIDGRDIAQVCHAKLLGVTISQDLTWNKHVDNIVKKAGKRLYMLYQLKRAGITQKDLVSVYVSVVRPVLEYACPVWHTNLPQYLSDSIEVIQKRALKCIFPGLGYAEILRRVNLDTLNVRRDSICQKKLDYPNTYARILFVDYSSAFNTVIHQQLYDKLLSQVVKMNSIISSTIIMNTGTPLGCDLSPLLYSLFTKDCFLTSLFCTIVNVCR